MWSGWVLWRLDVLRSHRVWSTRFPTLLPTRRHVVAVMVLLLVTITAAATVALTAGLSVAQASGHEQAVFDGITIAVMTISAIRLLTMAGPHAILNAFDQADHALLSCTPLTGADIVAGRVWLPHTVFTSICAVAAGTSLALATLVVGGALAQVLPTLGALALLVAAAAMTSAASCAFFSVAVALPPVLVGPVLFGLGIMVPVALALAAHLVSPELAEILTNTSSVQGALSALLENEHVLHLLEILHNHQPAMVAASLMTTLIAYFLTRAVSPRDIHRVRRALQGGHHWRTNQAFSQSLSASAGGKDVRLLVRRGIPAWQALDGVADLLPLVVLMALAGEVASPVTGATERTTVASLTVILINVCAVVAVVGMTSQALTSLLTSDADGPVLRLLSWRPDSLGRYLAAKSACSAVILATLGLLAAILVGAAASWPGGSWLAVCLVLSIGAATEAVCVVVGSAHRPAILRRDVGVSELEPSVNLASGLLTALVMTIATPLVVGAFYLPNPGWPGTIAAAVVTIPLAAWIAFKAGPRIYLSLENGGRREQHNLGHVGSA
jgi:hypothetical protein